MKKYSEAFERDYNWYLEHKDQFTFDGTLSTGDKIIFSVDGKSAKECFYKFDSEGKVIPTNEPELLFQIYKCKGAINFNIKMWAEDRAKGLLPKVLFSKECRDEQAKWFSNKELDFDNQQTIEEELELLPWMIEAVEHQKSKYYC